jgi:hypothetical protein
MFLQGLHHRFGFFHVTVDRDFQQFATLKFAKYLERHAGCSVVRAKNTVTAITVSYGMYH